ncbi:hypothetical protein QBC37DRAFT_145338 [Rhypophila decipiens]|uniref:Rhodopsin domain-containing protein n=1 Tax=Rhypophila decipiens TaxID=261697 RepID=A0AAN7B2Q7_9PEZI|nr:hypothetical protein QBC37DRAFT_145338 [Rhypophila decipiens]
MSPVGPALDPAAAAAAQAAAKAAMDQFTVEAFTLFAVALSVTILRTYARVRNEGIRGLYWDDYLVWIGTTAYGIETVLAYCVGAVARGLANNGMTDEQRAALSPSDPEYAMRQTGSKIQLSGWSTYSVLLWALKASLLVFYLRLTAGLGRSYRIRIYIGFAFLLASFIVVVMNLFLACRPFHHYWQIFPNPGAVCQPAIANQIVWTYFAMNVSTDLYLISIPVPMLWQANLKPLRKMGLIVLFSGGLFVVACATLRCVFIVTDPINGAQLAGSWAVRESFIAVVTTNLPMIFPLIKIWLAPLIGSLISFTTTRGTKGATGASATGDDKISKGSKNRAFGTNSQTWGRRGPPVNPLTNVTFTESEEAIVGKDNLNGENGHHHGAVKMQDMEGNGIGRTKSGTNNIRKHVQVSVTVSDSEDSSHHGGPPRKSMASDDHHHQRPYAHDLDLPGANGSSFAFARGPSSRSSFHFGNVA